MTRVVLRHMLLAAVALPLVSLPSIAQDRETRDAINKVEEYRTGAKPLDAAGREIFDKVAKYYAGKLGDANTQKDGMTALMTDVQHRFTIPKYPSDYEKTVNPTSRRTHNEEFGKILTAAVEPVLLENTRPIARINAARMLAETAARAGCDATANAFLKCLASPKESDAVKYWCLRGLHNLFAIVPEERFPNKTVFQKANAEQLPALEQSCILALIEFVNRKNDVKPDMLPEELDALRMVRREAIRALGLVRRQTVKNQGQVVARPAFVLLKVANRDGFTPPIGASEQIDGIVGFCQLFPDRDRDMQLDYAVANLGTALTDIGQYHILNKGDPSIPWKITSVRLKDALDFWSRVNDEQKIANSILIRKLVEVADQNLLKPFDQTATGNATIAIPAVRAFLDTIPLDKDKSSLFKSDESTKVKSTPWQVGN